MKTVNTLKWRGYKTITQIHWILSGVQVFDKKEKHPLKGELKTLATAGLQDEDKENVGAGKMPAFAIFYCTQVRDYFLWSKKEEIASSIFY